PGPRAVFPPCLTCPAGIPRGCRPRPMSFGLALGQGTPPSRAGVFGRRGRARGMARQEFAQHFPQPGWVEHEPRDLWVTTRRTALAALAEANLTARQIAAIGLTNQREPTPVWD